MSVAATQDYLRACIDLAADIGAAAVCGPFYAATGRVWRMDRRPADARPTAEWRENLAPRRRPRRRARASRVGIEPLNRYETSLINTVEQALERRSNLCSGTGWDLALDSYHLNIEEKRPSRCHPQRGRRDPAHLLSLQGDRRGAVQVMTTPTGLPLPRRS